MKIENKGHQSKLGSGLTVQNKTGLPALDKQQFPDVLEQFQSPNQQVALAQLLKELDEYGARLVKSFSLYDLKQYKDTLKAFLKDTYAQVYTLKEETGWTRQGKPKTYQLIQRINLEVEELSKLVLSKQRDPLKILEKLGQIRGIVVDLYS